MADNVQITAGSGTTVAADDIGGGVLAQRVKPVFGVDGTGTDVSGSNPLPVVQTGTPGLPTGAATSALQSTINTTLGSPMQETGGTVGLVAGGALVGKVGIDQTTPGTTNKVSIGTDGVLAAGAALIGDTGIQLRAGNGLSTSYTSCGNSNNATVVKASAGSVAGIRAFNNSGNVAYLKFYNKATTPSPASDTVVDKILIPANTLGAGVSINMPYGQAFTTGISFAVVGGFGDTDNTSVAANAFSVTVLYK